MIKVVGCTPEFDLLPLRAVQAIKEADTVVLQSGRTACAEGIRRENERIVALDDLYEQAEDFEALFSAGAQRVLEAEKGGSVVFCAVGDPFGNGILSELEKGGASLTYVAGGYGEAAAISAAAQRMDISGYTVLCAREIDALGIDTGKTIVLTGVENLLVAEGVKCALSDYYREDTQVLFYADGKASWLDFYDIDRITQWKEGGILVLPPQQLVGKERYGLYDLVRIMKILRGENGCPWDAEQTHKSLRQYILEEAYETVDAVDAGDMFALYDELGDVFLQVVFQSEVARQCGEFDIDDVATSVCAKMIGRHPHIFGNATADTANEVFLNWEAIKRKEKKNEDFVSVLRDVPRSMGAMMRAYKLQKKAAAVGFDWSGAKEALPKVEEELAEWKVELHGGTKDAMEDEAGDLLFAIINVLRLMKTNPELCLNKTCEKFIERLAFMEEHAEKELSELTLPELDCLWERAKHEKADKIGKNAEKMG